jgi:hypothetical protein
VRYAAGTEKKASFCGAYAKQKTALPRPRPRRRLSEIDMRKKGSEVPASFPELESRVLPNKSHNLSASWFAGCFTVSAGTSCCFIRLL